MGDVCGLRVSLLAERQLLGLPRAEREGVHGGCPHAGGLLRRDIRMPQEDLVARGWVHRPVRAPPRAEPPPRLSAPLLPRGGEVVGIPPAQVAVTESGLPVEIEPLSCLAARAKGRVGFGIYLLIAPVHR